MASGMGSDILSSTRLLLILHLFIFLCPKVWAKWELRPPSCCRRRFWKSHTKRGVSLWHKMNRWHNPARALRALGLLLADGPPNSGVGEDFLARRPVFFYENSRNTETKSRTIDPKVQNGPTFRGVQLAVDKIWDQMAKNGFSVRKSEFLGRNRGPLLKGRHVARWPNGLFGILSLQLVYKLC